MEFGSVGESVEPRVGRSLLLTMLGDARGNGVLDLARCSRVAIPFECFIPEQIDGFLPAEKNISQSRMANGATRLQPHTMLMG